MAYSDQIKNNVKVSKTGQSGGWYTDERLALKQDDNLMLDAGTNITQAEGELQKYVSFTSESACLMSLLEICLLSWICYDNLACYMGSYKHFNSVIEYIRQHWLLST